MVLCFATAPDQHGVLEVYVVVLGAMEEEVRLPPQRLQPPEGAALVVTLEVLVQRTHVPLRVILQVKFDYLTF